MSITRNGILGDMIAFEGKDSHTVAIVNNIHDGLKEMWSLPPAD